MNTSSGSRVPGRPRSPRIDEDVLEATWRLLEVHGYSGLSLDAVARAAGTSRPAIYRRWSGRPALVLAAVERHLGAPEPPDTGCSLCDVGDGFNVFLAAYREMPAEELADLYADCASDPELRTRYLSAVVEPGRRVVGRSLDRAFERGDLRPDTDRDLLLDMVGSLVHYRAMFGEHLTDSDADRALRVLLQGVAADYDQLLAHAEAMDLADHAAHDGARPASAGRSSAGR